MARFCAKCGSALNEQTGRCPRCDNASRSASPQVNNSSSSNDNSNNKPSKKEQKKQLKEDKKRAKRAAMSTGEKIRSFFLKLFICILLLAILAAGVTGALVYFDIVDIPFVEDIFVSFGLKEEADEDSDIPSDKDDENDPNGEEGDLTDYDVTYDYNDEDMQHAYEVELPDADSYFKNNSEEVVADISAKSSDSVHSESQAYSNLYSRGFTEYPITTEYTMDGELIDTVEISETSSDMHPLYQTYYKTESGDIWTVFEINGAVFANPVSYNLSSSLDAKVMISETDTITSYDSTKNKFYETIPKDTLIIVKTVDRIDADTLESLTTEAIDKL